LIFGACERIAAQSRQGGAGGFGPFARRLILPELRHVLTLPFLHLAADTHGTGVSRYRDRFKEYEPLGAVALMVR
jgi:hypothetical protein